MATRHVEEKDVKEVVEYGEVIETYLDDKPYPSCLMLGRAGGRPLHVVVAVDEESAEKIFVTVYEPDNDQWFEDLKTRRKA